MSSQQPQRKASTFLIMSDTHSLETADFNPEDCPLANKLFKVDVLLHCGDLTQVGGLSAYKKALRLISSYDAEVSISTPPRQLWQQ
jgi:predicted phosphodiesterase